MQRFVIGIMVLLLAATAQAEDHHLGVAYSVLVAAHTADILTTRRAFNRGHTEGNPLLPDNLPGVVLVKAGTTAATIWIVRRLDRINHWLAVASIYVEAAIYSWAAIENHRRVQRAGRRMPFQVSFKMAW